ncbi:MAG: GtrA family protein [Rhizobiaceae bacterium]|nr:GtrA family protein [Rhizobiaceae bacterium]
MRRVARFGLAGAIGFAVDFAVLAAALASGFGPYAGRAVSFFAAVAATYLVNARFTFGAGHRIGTRTFLLYLGASMGGLTVNLGAYLLLIWAGAPALAALAIASLCGMTLNYLGYARIF